MLPASHGWGRQDSEGLSRSLSQKQGSQDPLKLSCLKPQAQPFKGKLSFLNEFSLCPTSRQGWFMALPRASWTQCRS